MPKRIFSLNKTAIVPRTGEVLSLRKMVKGMARTREGLGVPLGIQRAFVRRQAADFEKLQEVFSTYDRTGSIKETSTLLGISEKTAARYISGKALPRILSTARLKHFMKKRRPLNLSQKTLPSLAYVFGAMLAGDAVAGRDYQQMKISKIYLEVKDFVFAREFQKHLANIGIKNKMTKRNGFYVMTPLSVSLLSLFNKLTSYGKKPPSINRALKFVQSEFPELNKIGADLLALPQGRKMLVRGLFDGIGWIGTTGKSQTINVKIHPKTKEISEIIIQVLQENGISPNQYSDGRLVIPSNQTRLFLERIGISKDKYPSKLF